MKPLPRVTWQAASAEPVSNSAERNGPPPHGGFKANSNVNQKSSLV